MSTSPPHEPWGQPSGGAGGTGGNGGAGGAGGVAGAGGYPPPPPSPGGYPPPPSSWQETGWKGGPTNTGAAGWLAGWWRRVGATLVDGLLVGIVIGIPLAIAGVSTLGRYVIEPFAVGAYQIFMIGGMGGQTLGNRAASTRVIDAATGAPAGYDRAVPRALVMLVLGFTGIGAVLDALWPLWDSQKQTLHDKFARTVVLRTDVVA